MEVVAALEFLFQKFDALLVDFDGSEFHGAVQEVLRERAVARTDFQHNVVLIYGQVPRNQFRGRDIQEVLSEFSAAGSIHDVKNRKSLLLHLGP